MTTEDDDDKKVVKDGERITVPMYMMDRIQKSVVGTTLRHAPGFVSLSDKDAEAKRAIYDAADKKLGERWRGGEAASAKPQTTQDAAYASYNRRISEAWRGVGP
jgi:hypothetical protein